MGRWPTTQTTIPAMDSPNNGDAHSRPPLKTYATFMVRSITTHIDLFEKLCTQMTHNDPQNPPSASEEQRIDWFLDSVTEKSYDSIQATCSDANIGGTLTFNKMIKLFTHKCFQRYPHFQIQELVSTNKPNVFNKLYHNSEKGETKRKRQRTRI
jgi:hypothetical protein